MKRIIALLMTFAVAVLCMGGCVKKLPENGKINIVATVFPPYDFARIIAGDKANVIQLVRPGGESHSFDPTPADIENVQDCDLFLCIGGEDENWVKRILESAHDMEQKTVTLCDSVTLRESGGEHHDEHAHHGHHHSHDEHIWTSPLNAIEMSKAILNALVEKDSANKEYYEENYLKLETELLALDTELRELNVTKTLVFGDRFPFLYLTEEYGFEYISAFPGCAEQTEPDIKTLMHLVEHIKEEGITTVFYTEFSNKKTAEMLCEETGAQPLLLHSCHNLTKDEWENGESYVSLMKRNFENIKKMAD